MVARPEQMKNEPELIGRQELANMLGVSRKTVEAWDLQKRIPGRVKVGHLIKYQRSEIQRRFASGELLYPAR